MSADSSTPPSLKHELRTPLNHIIGFCEMLIEEAEDDGAGARAALVPDLLRIHEAGRRLLGVINELFDSSIPQTERLDETHLHHEVRTPLNQIIGYTELLQEVAGESGDTAVLVCSPCHARRASPGVRLRRKMARCRTTVVVEALRSSIPAHWP